jgi:hypothetical protein
LQLPPGAPPAGVEPAHVQLLPLFATQPAHVELALQFAAEPHVVPFWCEHPPLTVPSQFSSKPSQESCADGA